MRKDRLAAIIAALLVAGLAVAAQAAQLRPRWMADPTTGCKVWDPAPQAHETVRWTGLCKSGVAEGQGTVQWFESGKAGDRYAGAYRHGRPNGFGVLTFSNGETVRGEWDNGTLIQLPANEVDFIRHR
ncbi:MAG: hypothetical protein ACREFL_14630 [Stellaceae bacterium]